MVAAAQPLATEAGVRMLELGGNAADAAVAAAFAIAVVEPTMNSIGGRNQILVRLSDGEVLGIDGTTQAPWDYDYDTAPQASYGYPVVGVPGAVAGLLKLHSEHGSLPLETVMDAEWAAATGQALGLASRELSALGSDTGGARIVSGVVQVVSRVVDDGMTLSEALEAPRVHRDRSGRLDAETSPVIGWSEDELGAVRALGLEVLAVPRAGAFSRVHAIHFDRATGMWHGVADPDWEGSARGPMPGRQ